MNAQGRGAHRDVTVAPSMGASITLHRFCGIKDPAWQLSDQRTDEFLRLLRGSPLTTPPGDDALYPSLGDMGFSVSQSAGETPFVTVSSRFAEFAGAQSRFEDIGGEAASYVLELEQLVLQGDAVDGISVLETHYEGPKPIVAEFPGFGTIPIYRPGLWNDNWTIRHKNNCYNYATNEPTNSFAQPGRAHGVKIAGHRCDQVARGAIADNLVPVDSTDDKLENGHYVALVLWPDQDFHWYRKDTSGYWSHKPGSTRVRDWDNEHEKIVSPETCDRGKYTVFCGYFIADETRVGIRMF